MNINQTLFYGQNQAATVGMISTEKLTIVILYLFVLFIYLITVLKNLLSAK